MCLESQKYRGFVIYRNENDDFHSEYFSIFNPKNNRHVHINKEPAAKSIVDCYYAKCKSKYGRIIRNKSMRLAGYNVLF